MKQNRKRYNLKPNIQSKIIIEGFNCRAIRALAKDDGISMQREAEILITFGLLSLSDSSEKLKDLIESQLDPELDRMILDTMGEQNESKA